MLEFLSHRLYGLHEREVPAFIKNKVFLKFLWILRILLDIFGTCKNMVSNLSNLLENLYVI